MKLINTDGIALIGPGSEWFWTALTGIVLAGTALAIYRQLSDGRAATALARMETLDTKYQSASTVFAQLQVLIALRDGKTLEAGKQAARVLFFFFAQLADLHAIGAMSDKEIYEAWGWAIRPWWRLLEPLVRLEQETLGFGAWNGFEQLEALCARRDKKQGIVRPILEGPFDFAGYIARGRARLQLLYDVDAKVMPRG